MRRGPQGFSIRVTPGTGMELLVVINLDEKTQEGPDLGPSTLAQTFLRHSRAALGDRIGSLTAEQSWSSC